jgi:glycosyltransferase involved in cell wall biosynthesis
VKKFLCIGTEWFSKKGGLSTFNRKLCQTLAKKNKVYCYVPEFGLAEFENAKLSNVTLISPRRITGSSLQELMYTKPPIPEPDWPDVVIGHDRITGSWMEAICIHHCKNSKRILFIHTDPEEIEMYKPEQGETDSVAKAEERGIIQKNLALNSSLIVTVGPKLFMWMKSLMEGVRPHPLIVQFNPGLYDEAQNIDYSFESIALETLILGRLEDFSLKGVDVAAKAMEITYEKLNVFLNGTALRPNLIIRGTPVGSNQSIMDKFNEIIPNAKVRRIIKNYTPDASLIMEDIKRASIILMPSRVEGFGLVGLEAISLGRPILITENSGLAVLLREIAPEESSNWIVKAEGFEENISTWAEMIIGILRNRKIAGERLKSLVDLYAAKITWDGSVDELEKQINGLTKTFCVFNSNEATVDYLYYHGEQIYDNVLKRSVGEKPNASYSFIDQVIRVERKDNEGRNIIDMIKYISSVGIQDHISGLHINSVNRKIKVAFKARTNGKAINVFIVLHQKGNYGWLAHKMFQVKNKEWTEYPIEFDVPLEMDITVQIQEKDFKSNEVVYEIKDLIANEIQEGL